MSFRYLNQSIGQETNNRNPELPKAQFLIFSCEEAALEVQMSLCPSVCVSDAKLNTSKRNVQGRTLKLRGM